MLFTISAPNRLQPLNGNKHILILLLSLFLLPSCAFLQDLFGEPEPEKPPVVIDKHPEEKEDTLVIDEPQEKEDHIKDKKDEQKGKWAKRDVYRISYILPFHLDRTELENLMSQDNITGMQSLASLEFYEGSLMALDTLQEMGLNLEVSLFDDLRDVGRLEDILDQYEMIQSDVVIGPLFNSSLEVASEWAKANEKFIVSPLSPSSSAAKENPWFLMANSTLGTQLQTLLLSWTKQSVNYRIIIASKGETGTDSLIKAEMIKAWDALKVDGYKPQLAFANSAEAVQNSMIQGRDNFVFLASTDELFVNGMMRQLSLFTKNYDLEVGGLSPVLDMESLSLDYFENLHFQYPSAYWVNPLSPKLENFINDFGKRYNSNPTDYAMRGYDLTLYVGYLLLQNGPFLPEGFSRPRPTRKMLYEFKFGPSLTSDGATDFYENKNVYILRFDNYRFEQVRE